MKSPNLRIIKPRAVFIPIQPKIIMEFFAVVKVAVIKQIASRGLGMQEDSLNFQAKGIIIGDVGGGMDILRHLPGLMFLLVNIEKNEKITGIFNSSPL